MRRAKGLRHLSTASAGTFTPRHVVGRPWIRAAVANFFFFFY
jgi:hypothetical protein